VLEQDEWDAVRRRRPDPTKRVGDAVGGLSNDQSSPLTSPCDRDTHGPDAIERLQRTPARVDLARAHLLYGEWLRREGLRSRAREELRTAHEMLEAIGLSAFSGRAARELAATGERVRRRTPEARDDLTERESQIARLAAAGYSNRRIGEQLFISHRTVGYHLGKVFTKLGVDNRAQLHAVLGETATPAGTN